MAEATAARLSADHWIEAGLSALVAEGAAGLKAERLAARLKVSRGSFYWHFKNVAEFHTEVLAHWRRQATESVISLLAQEDGPEARLEALMRRAYRADGGLERAVRAWGSQSAAAAAAIAGVDARRIAYLQQQFKEAGLDDLAASSRSRFVYWAYLGRACADDPDNDAIDDASVAQITRRLLDL